MLVRSWNLFHGNTVPTRRNAYLDEMVRLATADRPDVVCLQEVPPWAFGHLERWSGMRAVTDVAAPPRVGPLPSTPTIGRALTSVHHGLLRSGFSGQGNGVLLGSSLGLHERDVLTLNDARFRRAQARWLGLDVLARLAWAKERRICQAVRARLTSGRTLLLANLHATAHPRDARLADAELLRAAVWADGLAEPDDVVVLAGDFNVREGRSRTLADLAKAEWGFAHFGHGVDHVLVRGAAIRHGSVWPDGRRRLDGRLLSDHAPVDVELEVAA